MLYGFIQGTNSEVSFDRDNSQLHTDAPIGDNEQMTCIFRTEQGETYIYWLQLEQTGDGLFDVVDSEMIHYEANT